MRPLAVLLLSSVFFLSGLSALVFETLWFRQARLTFGGSVWASALVLSSFMAGLAVGNGLAARFGHRIVRPIRLYAVLELAIGIAGLSLVWLLPDATPFVAKVLRPFFGSAWMLRFARFAAAFLLLASPAVAMGATLPVLVRAFVGGGADFGRVLGWLYGINTLGAVSGAVTSELVWIRIAGVIGSGALAAGLNLLAAGLSLMVARSASVSTETAPGAPARKAPLGLGVLRLLSAAFLSGAALLALEVVWFRMLVLVVPQTSAAFGWMLGVVLAGIALGGLLAAGLLRVRGDLDQLAGAAAFAAGAVVVGSYALYPWAAARFANPNVEDPFAILPVSAVLMLPTSLLSGVLFTWLGRRLYAELGSDVRSAGLLTLANTFGSMLGPLAASFAMLPLVGVEGSVWWIGAGYGVVALCAIPPRSPAAAPRTRRRVQLVAAAAFAGSLATFPFGQMRGVYGWFLEHTFASDGNEELVALHEGVNQTIGFTSATYLGEPYYYRLVTDGYSMSGTRVDAQRYMSLFAHLPYAFHARPRDALLISYGVGITAGALLSEPDLESLDVVDISRDILRLSSAVVSGGRGPLADPRVRVHIEDGRYFLQVTERAYDVITGEPPPPAAAGVASLYTREYFGLLRSRLRSGGLASYWLPVWQLAEDDAKAIVGAFCAAFPDCSLWEGTPLDWILLGTRDAWGPLDEDAIRRQWTREESRERLRAIGIEKPEQLAALFLADADFLRRWVGDTPPLVDNWPDRAPRWGAEPWVGGVAPRHYAEIMDEFGARERFARSVFVAKLWPAELRRRSLPYFRSQETARRFLLHFDLPLDTRELHRLLTETDLETIPLWLLGSDADKQRIVSRARGDDPRTRDAIAYHLGVRALAARDYATAARHFDRVDAREFPKSPRLALYALAMAGRLDEATERARSPQWLAGAQPIDPGYWSFMKATFGVEPPLGLGLAPAGSAL